MEALANKVLIDEQVTHLCGARGTPCRVYILSTRSVQKLLKVCRFQYHSNELVTSSIPSGGLFLVDNTEGFAARSLVQHILLESDYD